MDDFKKQAIEASLAGDFNTAIILNKKILEQTKNDVEALNRLGCAYLKIGKIDKAKETYKKGLLIDCYNPIILKNLKKIEDLKGNFKPNNCGTHKLNNFFLSEPGKTKLVSLINLAPTTTYLHLPPGTPVCLIPKRHVITICFKENLNQKESLTYLGTLPDDLSFKLLRMIKGGNRYEAYIKTVSKNNLSVFIREIFRAKKLKDQPSFLDNSVDTSNYLSDA